MYPDPVPSRLDVILITFDDKFIISDDIRTVLRYELRVWMLPRRDWHDGPARSESVSRGALAAVRPRPELPEHETE